MSIRILRLPEVKAQTSLSKSTIYARISANEFPKPISLGGRAVGWTDQSILNWIESRERELEGESVFHE
jgi:prophage regulatory protein